MDELSERLRELPSVDQFLRLPEIAEMSGRAGRDLVKKHVRRMLDLARSEILSGSYAPIPSSLIEILRASVTDATSSPLRRVINATGVVIHTNLGRAPLSNASIRAIEEVASGYSNLEYDLDAGARGSRDRHAEQLLQEITGAEAALVVNNNASALLLSLSTLANGKEAVVSRGQAVEIGGGFRIPDVMRQSGARLVEVGTTNRTYIADYRNVVGPDTAVLLRVHASNFKVVGFTAETSLEDLCALANERGVDVIDDLGSGCLLDTSKYGLAGEPLIQASVASGASIICFSGDKLLGGPQAGIVLGKKAVIDRVRRHPLARALRIDKLSLAALLATLLHYLKGEAEREIPVWRMISASKESLDQRANGWQRRLGGSVTEGRSAIGGGSLPGETLPTSLLALEAVDGVDAFSARLRTSAVSVLGRVEHGKLLLDPRTVLAEQDEALIAAVTIAMPGKGL